MSEAFTRAFNATAPSWKSIHDGRQGGGRTSNECECPHIPTTAQGVYRRSRTRRRHASPPCHVQGSASLRRQRKRTDATSRYCTRYTLTHYSTVLTVFFFPVDDFDPVLFVPPEGAGDDEVDTEAGVDAGLSTSSSPTASSFSSVDAIGPLTLTSPYRLRPPSACRAE